MNLEQMKKIVNGAPDGATHIDHMGRYWDLPKGLVFQNNTWMKDGSGFACIWKPL